MTQQRFQEALKRRGGIRYVPQVALHLVPGPRVLTLTTPPPEGRLLVSADEARSLLETGTVRSITIQRTLSSEPETVLELGDPRLDVALASGRYLFFRQGERLVARPKVGGASRPGPPIEPAVLMRRIDAILQLVEEEREALQQAAGFDDMEPHLAPVREAIGRLLPRRVSRAENLGSFYDGFRTFALTDADEVVLVDRRPLVGNEDILDARVWLNLVSWLSEMRATRGRLPSGDDTAGLGLLLPLLVEIRLMGGELITPLAALAGAVADGEKTVTVEFVWRGRPRRAVLESEADLRAVMARYAETVDVVVMTAAMDLYRRTLTREAIAQVLAPGGLLVTDQEAYGPATASVPLAMPFGYAPTVWLYQKPHQPAPDFLPLPE
jgi:hypothetical protein